MNQSTTTAISLPAERMRRYRQRRREGLRCLTVQLRETEIDVLICKGLLKPEMRHNKNAIINALHDHFDLTLSMRPMTRNGEHRTLTVEVLAGIYGKGSAYYETAQRGRFKIRLGL